MSTPAKKETTVTEESGTGAVDVFLHALVVINISDHFTRERVNNPKTAKHRIFGALLGQQTGRIVHVYNSFELICTDVNGQLIIDTEYLKTKKEQFRKVFPDLEFLGWYSTGKEAQVSDLDIHKQLLEYNESPLFLLLDPVPSADKRELPIVVYETELKVIKDEPTLRFAKVQYKIETGEAERIAVDHVARVGSAGNQSMLTSHLSSMHNAIKMLNIRIKSIVSYLEAVKAGKLPADQSVLRRLSSLVNLLPAIESANFNNEFLSEYNDALLVTYLASITKTSNSMNEMIDKFNITFDRHTRRRGFY